MVDVVVGCVDGCVDGAEKEKVRFRSRNANSVWPSAELLILFSVKVEECSTQFCVESLSDKREFQTCHFRVLQSRKFLLHNGMRHRTSMFW